jgi:hypothetical protein
MTDITERWRTGRATTAIYEAGVERDRVATVGGWAMWGADMRRMFADVERLADAPVGTCVLDIPCGSGFAFCGNAPHAGEIKTWLNELGLDAVTLEHSGAVEFFEAQLNAKGTHP